jgi:hypothetical protein
MAKKKSVKKKTKSVICYMDKVDFEEELGKAVAGNRVFPSVDACRKSKACVHQCGIVEVEIRLRKVIVETDFTRKIDITVF